MKLKILRMTEVCLEAGITSDEAMDVDSPSELVISANTTDPLADDIKTEYEEPVKEENEEGGNEAAHEAQVENVSPSSEQEKYSCPLCKKEFQNKSSRYNHIRIHHKLKMEFGKVHCLEAGCLFSCTYTTVLQQHLTEVHNIPMKYLNLEFDNYEEFEKWKHNFETGEVCRFVKKSGARVGDTGKSMYLYCSRSGTFVSQGKGQRFKKLGSAKISAHCTALIKYFEESSGKVKATVCSTHYGHDRDHRFLRLTQVQKRNIAEKMKSGVPRELVLDSVRSSFVNKLDRIHELSKKDLNNIQKSFKIPKLSAEPRKAGDVVVNPWSIFRESWTSEMDVGDESPVLYYKEANVEAPYLQLADKCLVVMTKGQRDLFTKFCSNGVLYASTLKLSTTLPLYLIVIFVLDNFYEMFPVCFMVASDKRKEMMRVCFNEILNMAGPVVVRAFATDNQPDTFDAWCDIMGPASRNPIVANRHVDAEWRANLTLVRDECLQGDIYDKLYEFIENADGTRERFEALIAELRTSCLSSEFASYLEKNFLPTIHLWSTHYLRHRCNLRQSIDFEGAYNKVATLCELSCKYNKSVGYTTRGLIKLLLELQATRNRRVAEHITEIRSAHALALESSTECVFPLTGSSWKVRSELAGQHFYEVFADSCDFEDCVLVCAQCQMCVHAFCCECDAYADTRTCVHVHLVGTMVKTSAANVTKNGVSEQMLCSVDRNNEMHAEIDEGPENSCEVRSLKAETLRMLDDVSRRLAGVEDENNLKRIYALVSDVHGNIDMLLNYGGHAKNVEFVKTSKPIKKKEAKSKTSATTKAATPKSSKDSGSKSPTTPVSSVDSGSKSPANSTTKRSVNLTPKSSPSPKSTPNSSKRVIRTRKTKTKKG